MKENSVQVYKFGGSSVKDANGYRTVADIIGNNDKGPLVVVLSAMGKTTNALEQVVEHLFSEERVKAIDQVKKIQKQHEDIIQDLDLGQSVVKRIRERFDQIVLEMDDLVEKSYDAAYDEIICRGELSSSDILSELIQRNEGKSLWLDARQLIATNGIHRDATVDWSKTASQVNQSLKPVLNEFEAIVTQGFIGGFQGETTTLGREGSDYSGAILSFVLDAEELSIWKDVPGILTGDPREFEHVIKLDRLSYKEATEMTYYGAKVIHPKTIKPLQNKGIRLHVRPFLQPEEDGTMITHDVEVAYPPIVVIEKNQCLLHISTRDFSFVAEHHMSLIFNMISSYRIKVNMMRNTAISFTVCVTQKGDRLERLIEDLSSEFGVVCDSDLELITLRHYTDQGVKDLIGNRIVIFEERIKDTIQMVVRRAPGMRRKSDG